MYGAYGNEIPDTLYFRNSYEEMIHAFKQMQSSYQETLDSITRLQEQLNRYENSIDDRFSTIESNIPRLVTQAVDNAMNQYLTQLNNINNTINFIQQQVSENALTENNHFTYITGELLSINGELILDVYHSAVVILDLFQSSHVIQLIIYHCSAVRPP